MRHHRLLFPLLLILGCLYALTATAAGAGTVVYLAGHPTATGADGKTRALQKSAPVHPGDTLLTGKDGQLDIRFSDDSLLQLQPESQFRIDAYVFNGKADGQERAAYNLLKGAFRTVTGAIGKRNKENYAVVTAVAFIGIRGTDYTANLSKGLRVAVHRGEISLSNRAGSFAVAEGQSAFVRDADTAPVYQSAGEGGKGTGAGAGNTRIRGSTRIDASADKTNASASGRDNRARNQAGVIGGE